MISDDRLPDPRHLDWRDVDLTKKIIDEIEGWGADRKLLYPWFADGQGYGPDDFILIGITDEGKKRLLALILDDDLTEKIIKAIRGFTDWKKLAPRFRNDVHGCSTEHFIGVLIMGEGRCSLRSIIEDHLEPPSGLAGSAG